LYIKKNNISLKGSFCICLFICTFLFSNELNVSLSDFEDDRINHIILHLEPFGISTYIYNKYYPNYTVDHYENGYFIDGALGLPIYQNISHKLYFDQNERGTFTQLSYKQKKSDLFFDTKIALKTDINNNTNFVFKGESKSIVNNINQNYVLNINKIDDDASFKVGYMYHIEDVPNIDFYQNINQKIESFNLGYAYALNRNKLNLNMLGSIQISNNDRLLDNTYFYELRTTWTSLDLLYQLNKNLSMIFDFSNKKHFLEKNIESSTKQYKNHSNIGINYSYNNFNLILAIEKLNEEYLPKLKFDYYLSKTKISIIYDNFIASTSLNENLDILYENINNYRLELLYKKKKYNNLLSIGQIKTPLFKYMYYSTNTNVNFKYGIIDFKYYYYDSDLTYFKENFILSCTLLPPIKSNKYKIYGKISSNNFKINEAYDINLENINLFELNNSSIVTNYNVNLLDVEFGFVFKTFKISFIRKNPLENEIFINQNNISFIRYDYIDVVWYFQD